MKTLTILTQDYRKDLETALNVRCSAKGTLYAANNVSISSKNSFNALACLLERITILQHPVYGHSPKLIEIAQSLHHDTMHEANVNELIHYYGENNILHLEGYTIFRMANYKHRLDMLMYCAIKKLKLTDALL